MKCSGKARLLLLTVLQNNVDKNKNICKGLKSEVMCNTRIAGDNASNLTYLLDLSNIFNTLLSCNIIGYHQNWYL